MALFFDFLQFFDQITVEIPDKMEYNDTREIKGGPAVLNIVLVEPEIPQNTGNIARTCAATRSRLHLIKPLGFDISEKAVRRAGLDYWNMVDLQVYEGLDHFFEVNPAPDLWLATTKAPRDYTMRPDARSLNLANSVAVLTYEALRQLDFPGLSGEGEMAEKGRSQVL